MTQEPQAPADICPRCGDFVLAHLGRDQNGSHATWDCSCGFNARRRHRVGESLAPVVDVPVLLRPREVLPTVHDVLFANTWGLCRRAS